MKKIIMLFGEAGGVTMENNSFFVWKRAIKYAKAYFVYDKNANLSKEISTLTKKEKSLLIKKNSIKHFWIYFKSDLLLVSTSFADVIPNRIKLKENKKPIIYLTHGVEGLKKLYYNPLSYHNKLSRFVYFNKNAREALESDNFLPYQLIYMPVQPRYVELLEISKRTPQDNSILFFITWRENGNQEIEKILVDINNHKWDVEVNVILHDYILLSSFEHFENINIYKNNDVNVKEYLSRCSLCITDYSSVIWDAAFIGKKVLLYMPDYKEYYKKRDSYCKYNQVANIVSHNFESLIEKIESPYIDSYFHTSLDYKLEDIENCKFIDDFVIDIVHKYTNKVIFVGYGLMGIGGTVSATKGEAQKILEKGGFVEMYSLTKKGDDMQPLPGANMLWNFDRKNYPIINKIYRCVPPTKFFRSDYNSDKVAFNFFTEWKFKRYLKNSSASTIISTRESYNYYVNKYSKATNKKYIFHTDIDVQQEMSPKIININAKLKLEEVIFVSESSKNSYFAISKLNYGKCNIQPNKFYQIFEPKKVRRSAIEFILTRMEIIDNKLKIEFYFIDDNKDENYTVKLNNDFFTVNPTIPMIELDTRSNTEFHYFFDAVSKVDVSEIDFEDFELNFAILEQTEERPLLVNDTTSHRMNTHLMYRIDNGKKAIEFYLENCKFIVANTYESSGHLKVERLKNSEFVDIFYANRICCVFRISEDRKQYIDELIEFGKLIEGKYTIDVFGTGNLVDYFRNEIYLNGLQNTIFLKGAAANIVKDTRYYDKQISLSRYETFGMTYIEAIISGKKLLCMENSGSKELFKDYPFIYHSEIEDLVDGIEAMNDIDYSVIRDDFIKKYSSTSHLYT